MHHNLKIYKSEEIRTFWCFRFAAEMPHLEEERVQKLLPWLVQLQDSTATAYLLPFLTLVTGPDMPEKTRQKWINCTRQAKVMPIEDQARCFLAMSVSQSDEY